MFSYQMLLHLFKALKFKPLVECQTVRLVKTERKQIKCNNIHKKLKLTKQEQNAVNGLYT